MSNALWWSSSHTDTSHASSSTSPTTLLSTTIPSVVIPFSTNFMTSVASVVGSESTTALLDSTTKNTLTPPSISASNTLPNSNHIPSSSPVRASSTIVVTTVTLPFTTFVSSSVSLVPANLPTGGIGNAASNTGICIGTGIDVTAIGVLATTVLCSAVGLLLWLLFAYLRPKFRQVYSVREWFVAPGLRPKPLRKTLWAFLWPHVPLIPLIPKDVSSYSGGRNPQVDAALFPSDEELAQRTLWHAFLLVLAWSILGLGGALPLYLVDTPCVADATPSARFGGQYSTLQDLSLLRLLNLLPNLDLKDTPGSVGQFLSDGLSRRATFNGKDVTRNTEIRLIVLAVLVVVIAAIPAAYKFLHEFTRLVSYRRRWIDVRCGGIEMGWLSKANARGFDGWGENQLKDFLIKTGLSKGFKNSGGSREGFAGVGANGRSAGEWPGQKTRDESSPQGEDEKGQPELDLQGLFTVADTTRLTVLLNERDVILNNLEMAETRYINSFRLSTPSPSVIDFETPEESNQVQPSTTSGLKNRIGRPKALSSSANARTGHPRRRRLYTPGPMPTSYVAPSSYYKLHDVRGVGRMSSDGTDDSLAQRISQRVIGSRFQEIHRDSFAFGRIPLGSHVQLDDRTGTLGPVRFSQDQLRHGPNDPSSGNEADTETPSSQPGLDTTYPDPYFRGSSGGEYSAEVGPSTVHEEDEWTPTSAETHDFEVRPRPPKQQTPPPPERRSTFAMRSNAARMDADVEAVPPPHLRLQPQQPFVRPLSGMDHDDLGIVYSDIRLWRSQLKAINTEIADAQAENYNYIADGVNIKGWLLLGRGVRFLPGVQMIEGRSKEDIRYELLQAGESTISDVTFWSVVCMVTILLGASLIAVSALAVIPAPDVAHYLAFLRPLLDNNNIGVALATTLAPAIAASFFISFALFVVHYAARFSGSISVSSTRITAFKGTFFILTVVCCIWLTACGSMVFSLEALATGTQRAQTVASGSVYFAAFLLVLVINVAIISPALLMLQPLHLWHLLRYERNSVTPRQRFRAIYPRVYNPSYATACCLIAVAFAATFSLIFPLIGPAICILLFLTLIAHRYLIGYVYAKTDSGHTGGLLQIWLLRRLADLVALQPLLLGLILLTRHLWILGGILVGAAVTIVVTVEGYAWSRLRLPGINSLSPISRNSIAHFRKVAVPEKIIPPSEEPSILSSPRRTTLPRNSMASVLEMMSLTLAVMPSSAKSRGPVPLQTEDLDDLTATEQAARTNPNAPPRLPPLAFTTHSEEMQGILYAPELIAQTPVIWLPNDRSGVAQSEAIDLFRYHDLNTILDVSPTDAIPQSNDSRWKNPTT